MNIVKYRPLLQDMRESLFYRFQTYRDVNVL